MDAGVLLDLAWKGTAIAVAACVCAGLLRRSSAASRHLVWMLALIALLGLPLLLVMGPVWRLEVLPTRSIVTDVEATQSSARTLQVREASHNPSTGSGLSRAKSRDKGLPHTESDAPLKPVARTFMVRENILVIIWATGALMGLVRLLVGLGWAAWIARRATAITSGEWRAVLAEASAALQVRRRVDLRVSDRISVPVTCGIVRPTLLLPADADSWPAQRRRAVMLHELAHITRRDCLSQAAGHAARSIHWFNPLVHIALRRLRVEQERACDDLVIGAGMPSAEYARHLCDVASAFRSMPSPEWATLAMGRPSNLEGRVRAILDAGRRRHMPRRMHRAAAVLVTACLIPFSALRLAAVSPITGLPAVPAARGLLVNVWTAETPAIDTLGPLASVQADEVIESADAVRTPVHDSVAEIPPPDFSGRWVLDEARSSSQRLAPWDPRRDVDWADDMVIRQSPTYLRVSARRGEMTTSTSYAIDDREYRVVDERRPVGGGTSIHGRDVKSSWDAGKLVTLVRPFSIWMADTADESSAPSEPGTELVSIRRLSADGQEMVVERVNRHDWGWGFDGREPSAAYARVTDIYRRVSP